MKINFTINSKVEDNDKNIIFRFETVIKLIIVLLLLHVCLFSFGQTNIGVPQTIGLAVPATNCIDVAVQNTVKGSNAKCKYSIGDTVVFVAKVFRQDNNNFLSDTIIVKGQESPNLKFISYSGSIGTYDKANRKWTIKNLGLGDTLKTEVKFVVISSSNFDGGLICSEIWVDYMKNCDIDSTPGDKNVSEDDYDRTCISIPLKICRTNKEVARLIAPDGYPSYQWYVDGQLIDGANQSTYETNMAGNYTVQVGENKCPTPNCCPIIVEEFCPCLPNICVPISVKRNPSK